jgi:hypothetical protein
LNITIHSDIPGDYSPISHLGELLPRLFDVVFVAAMRRSPRISIKGRIRNVTIRQQIGLEEIIIKETELNRTS